MSEFGQASAPQGDGQSSEAQTVTQLLQAAAAGTADAADHLAVLVYQELHVLAVAAMRRESDGHTWRPTELVHEAFDRLVSSTSVAWKNRHHFYSVASRAMRRLLVDHARARQKLKRDGGERVPLTADVGAVDSVNIDVLALNDALDRLGALDARQVQVVELRYFGGFTIEEIAETLQISPATVKRDWTVARAFLRHALTDHAGDRD